MTRRGEPYHNLSGEPSGLAAPIEIPARPVQIVDTNVMRHEYRELSEAEKLNMRQIKDAGLIFYTLCDAIGASREMSLAKTKIEEAVMWATKHITR